MPGIPFAAIPDDARLWVYGAAQPLIGRDAEQLLSYVEAFLRDWHAHGAPVIGACDWLYDRFLFVTADEAATGVSGCSIDSLFRTLKGIENELGTSLLDASLVYYRDPARHVRSASRPEFRELVAAGEVADTTIVFDNTVGTVGAVRSGLWERTFAGSWHERAFRRRVRAG